MTADNEVLQELRKISKLITMSNGRSLEEELSKYATNNERKKIWVLIDGNKQTDEILKITGLTKTPVYNFLKILEDSGLVDRQHGKSPKRLLDYVPAKWAELIQSDTRPAKEESVQPETQGEQSG